MGQMGGESREYYTTGTLKNGIVHKKMWMIPELIVEKEYKDEEDECFKEAIIYDKTKTY